MIKQPWENPTWTAGHTSSLPRTRHQRKSALGSRSLGGTVDQGLWLRRREVSSASGELGSDDQPGAGRHRLTTDPCHGAGCCEKKCCACHGYTMNIYHSDVSMYTSTSRILWVVFFVDLRCWCCGRRAFVCVFFCGFWDNSCWDSEVSRFEAKSQC